MQYSNLYAVWVIIQLATAPIAFCSEGSIPEHKLSNPVFTEIFKQYQATEVDALIGIRTQADVTDIRKRIRRVVWGTDTLPIGVFPRSIQQRAKDHEYQGIPTLDHIDLITVSMPYGIKSKMYLFHNNKGNERLIIYHQGHKGDFLHGRSTIKTLLENGFDVIAISMPLLGKNNRPVAWIEGLGNIFLKDHDWMRFLDLPLSFFMSPILAATQHGLESTNYRDISLIGLSGGAWAVTLYAALDDRIANTYQVAGTMPYFLRSPVKGKYKGRIGDFEQNYLPLIKTANYLELYVAGSVGHGRRQAQIINQYNTVAAHGIKYRTYETTVAKRVDRIGNGGEFRVVLDSHNPDHSISRATLEWILSDLDKANDTHIRPTCFPGIN